MTRRDLPHYAGLRDYALMQAPASPAERIMRLMLTVCTSLAAGCLLAVVVKIAVEALT